MTEITNQQIADGRHRYSKVEILALAEEYLIVEKHTQ